MIAPWLTRLAQFLKRPVPRAALAVLIAVPVGFLVGGMAVLPALPAHAAAVTPQPPFTATATPELSPTPTPTPSAAPTPPPASFIVPPNCTLYSIHFEVGKPMMVTYACTSLAGIDTSRIGD